MRTPILLAAGAAAVAFAVGAVTQPSFGQRAASLALATELRPVASFADIADTQARSVALFEETGKVL